jgi:hypothetical protein
MHVDVRLQDAQGIYTVRVIGHINRREFLSGFFHIRDPPWASSAIARWMMVLLTGRLALSLRRSFAVRRSPFTRRPGMVREGDTHHRLFTPAFQRYKYSCLRTGRCAIELIYRYMYIDVTSRISTTGISLSPHAETHPSPFNCFPMYFHLLLPKIALKPWSIWIFPIFLLYVPIFIIFNEIYILFPDQASIDCENLSLELMYLGLLFRDRRM